MTNNPIFKGLEDSRNYIIVFSNNLNVLDRCYYPKNRYQGMKWAIFPKGKTMKDDCHVYNKNRKDDLQDESYNFYIVDEESEFLICTPHPVSFFAILAKRNEDSTEYDQEKNKDPIFFRCLSGELEGIIPNL